MGVVSRILKWDTLLIVALFVGTVLAMIWDPFGLNGPESVAVALYTIPAILIWLFVYVMPFHKKKKK